MKKEVILMQSLTKLSPILIIKKQVKWKAKLYISALSSLVILQIIFTLLFFNHGNASEGYGRGNVNVQFFIYSLDVYVMVAMLWAFITGLLFSTKAYRRDDLAIISSQTSSAVATILVVILYSMIAVMIIASSYYIQLIGLLLRQKDALIIDQLIISPSILLVCFGGICLFGAVGLLIGYCFHGPIIFKLAAILFFSVSLFVLLVYPEFINLQSFILLSNLKISIYYFLLATLCFGLTIWIAHQSEVSNI